MGVMQLALAALVLVGACAGDDNMTAPPDASVDGGDAVVRPDFYGEPCDPPSTPTLASICRNDAAYPKALCTPIGACRPWCDHVATNLGFMNCKAVGGVETWTVVPATPGGDRGFCYCAPPN